MFKLKLIRGMERGICCFIHISSKSESDSFFIYFYAGRPFVVEFVNPRMERLSVAELKNITQVKSSLLLEISFRLNTSFYQKEIISEI